MRPERLIECSGIRNIQPEGIDRVKVAPNRVRRLRTNRLGFALLEQDDRASRLG
jgi:hypothetical protein